MNELEKELTEIGKSFKKSTNESIYQVYERYTIGNLITLTEKETKMTN